MSDSAKSAEKPARESAESKQGETLDLDRDERTERGRRSRARGNRQTHPSQVNVRLVVGSVLLVSLLAGGTWFLHRYQKRRMSSALLTRADDAVATDWQQGRRLLREYAQLQPQDIDAKIKLAHLQMEHANTNEDWIRAFKTNEEILRHDGKQAEIRRHQVDVLFRLGRFSDARDHLERLLEEDPENGGLHLIMAMAYTAEKRYADAVGEFDKALQDPQFESVQLAPTNRPDQPATQIQRMDAYAAWAEVLHEELDQPDPAADKYDRMIEEHPESADALLLRADYRRRHGLTRQAASDARTALELEPENSAALVAAAGLTLYEPGDSEPEVSDSRIQSMYEALSRAVESGTDNREVYRWLALYEQREGDMDRALDALEKGVEQTKEIGDLLFILATRLADRGSEARDRLQSLTDNVDSLADAESEYVQGCLRRQEGQYLTAIEHFHRARELSDADSAQDQAARVQIAKCYAAVGRLDAALLEFERILTAHPQSLDAHLGAAQALVAIGNFNQAQQTYRSGPMFEAQTALELATVEFEVLRRSPANWENLEGIESALTKAEKLGADAIDLAMLRARVQVARGQVEAARQSFTEAQQTWPDRIEPRAGLVSAALVDNDLETARTVLEEAVEQIGPHPDLDILWLEYWRRADEAQFRTHLAELEQRDYSDERDRWIQLQELIARYYRTLGDDESRLRVLLNVANTYPDHVVRWFRLIELSLEMWRPDLVEQALQQLRRIEGEVGLYVRIGTAMRLYELAKAGDKRQLAEARTLLEAATKDVSLYGTTQGMVNALLGQVDLLEGKRKDAADRLLLATQQGIQSPNIWLVTAQLLIEQQRSAEALEILQSVAKSPVGGASTRMAPATASLLFQLDHREEALSLAHSLVAADPQDPSARILLGLAHATAGNLEDAEQEIREAIALAPQQAGGWVALVDLLMRQDKQSAAEDAVAEAEQAIRSEMRTLALATCYERIKRVDDAETMIREAVDTDPKDARLVLQLGGLYLRTGQPQLAETTLRNVLDDPDQYENVDLVALRRLLAPGIALSSFANYQEALRLLEQNIDKSLDPVVDRRLYARLLVAFPHPDFLRQGLEQFDNVERMASLSPTEHLLVAIAHDRLEDSPAAERHWQAVLEDDPPQPQAIAAYIDRELNLDQLDGLDHWTDELQTLQPEKFETIELQSRLDIHNGDLAAAFARLNEYSANAQDDADKRARRNQVAALLTKLGRSSQWNDDVCNQLFEEAGGIYQKLAPDHPESTIAYAMMLGYQGELQRALDELERIHQSVDTIQTAAAGVKILETSDYDEADIDRVKEWVDASRQSNPDSLFAIHIEESLRRMQQQYGEAIKLNRIILKQVPENIVALNNLAWLVSMHEQQHQEALELIARAMDVVGPKSFLLDTRGLIYLELGRLDAAIEDFRASWIQENLPATQFHLALALMKSGDRDSGKHNFKAAIEAGLTARDLEQTEATTFKRLSEELAAGYNDQ